MKTYRIHALTAGTIVEFHGTDDLETILRLERKYKADQDITSVSIYRNGQLLAEWIR